MARARRYEPLYDSHPLTGATIERSSQSSDREGRARARTATGPRYQVPRYTARAPNRRAAGSQDRR